MGGAACMSRAADLSPPHWLALLIACSRRVVWNLCVRNVATLLSVRQRHGVGNSTDDRQPADEGTRQLGAE